MSESLLYRIANGDQSAVSDCVSRYGGLIWSLARKFSASQSDAEDAVQEIFISLWKSAKRFDASKSSERTFVSMIARRRLIDLSRKKNSVAGKEVEKVLNEADVLLLEDPSRQVELSDEAEEAMKALRRLPSEQQQAIKLSVYTGLTHPQIAERMSLPLGTIKTHIRRGLLKVREQLRPSVVSNQGDG